MNVIKSMFLMQQFFNVTGADLIGINRYQNIIKNHNTGLQEIMVANSKTALESALLKQYYSFLAASTSNQKEQSQTYINDKFFKLKTIVKRTYRRNQYIQNMKS